MKKKVTVVLAVVLGLMVLATGCNKESKNDEKTLVVGFDQGFPPFGFVGDDGDYTGFDIDLAKEVAERLDMEIKFQPINWDAKDMELESGNIDCIWNGFSTNGREKDYTWTDPYISNPQKLMVKKDTPYTTKEDLKGKVVEVQKNSTAQTALEAMPDYMSTITVSYTSDYNKGFMDLKAGVVDAILVDDVVENYYITKNNDENTFRILDEALSTEKCAVGFKQGNTKLRDKVQKELEEMDKDGTLAKISKEWFGKDVTIIGE